MLLPATESRKREILMKKIIGLQKFQVWCDYRPYKKEALSSSGQ